MYESQRNMTDYVAAVTYNKRSGVACTGVASVVLVVVLFV